MTNANDFNTQKKHTHTDRNEQASGYRRILQVCLKTDICVRISGAARGVPPARKKNKKERKKKKKRKKKRENPRKRRKERERKKERYKELMWDRIGRSYMQCQNLCFSHLIKKPFEF